MPHYKIYADVLYSHVYEFDAPNKTEAQRMVDDEEVNPKEVKQVTSPVIVYVEENKK
jgi:hypothetical protein